MEIHIQCIWNLTVKYEVFGLNIHSHCVYGMMFLNRQTMSVFPQLLEIGTNHAIQHMY